ncbi:regulator of hemoglobinization and erythroid cell expansion protein isoform X1 [Lynx rufus]|uniref:regulator of hemoglobinization and erythroid cell expansion protein isoform X1 n=1 Tax=Lynx rufus TaxID=61384 RepID=UPI001F126AF3|nr:regulator of hemoglobinization and erythroid cell expansion protein isoform X1 [Lynx rufus]XP_046932553.1 regulator of hemoglobinization and erythroid cell expansion protein isoform X1 [Lynx rufus]XP_046932554.1 regulator of hemoglobinization and erythroid cell expansion protein isoform X1 [Lynx rufus]XP_046932555.1 regulator of hemoglobinization and erythroid cell expansion protein isoform X1 [Lynx rufus]XP_046932556.1 regulator of hemoglobinization and erythroid cell expansion protein isof
MLTEDMKFWHGLVIAVVSLILQTCLFAAINYLLSRHMASQSEQILKGARLQAPWSSRAQRQPCAATEETRSAPVSAPRHRHDSDTSSDSSNSADVSGSLPPTCQATKDVNYTQVVFSAPGGLKTEPALDYENIKETTDYVNVNPKSHRPNFWTFVNPVNSESVEYTQVAM